MSTMTDREIIAWARRYALACEKTGSLVSAENYRRLADLAALTETFEAVLAEADRPKGGMAAPFHGDFVGALRLPSVLGNMRWWAGEAHRVLSGEAGAVEHWMKAGEKR